MIPYGKHFIDKEDIAAVIDVLRSAWLTTGPQVDSFETAVAEATGSGWGVAFSSGTAALHAAMYAIGVGPGDEVIVAAMTFAATANCVAYQRATPVFADVTPENLLIDCNGIEALITERTRAIIGVDYAGHPCDWDKLRRIADCHGLFLVADSCHALGSTYKGRPTGSIADLTAFSFHPVKHITTGEGGMITGTDPNLQLRLKRFRNHGIDSDFRQREKEGAWFYQMVDLGFNYRITDLQCALGKSQLRKLPRFLSQRRKIAGIYDQAFQNIDAVSPLAVSGDVEHAYHLYVVRIDFARTGSDRNTFFRYMQQKEIRTNVHYIPVHLHPYYREQYGTSPEQCPEAVKAYAQIVSLPMYPGLSETEQNHVIESIVQFFRGI